MFEYNFAYCGDKNYIENYLPVLIRSIEFNNSGNLIHHILCNSRFNFELFSDWNCKFYLDENPIVKSYVGTPGQEHVNEATFLKFSLLNSLPKSLKVMYCDIDQICTGNIQMPFSILNDKDCCGFISTDSIWCYKMDNSVGSGVLYNNALNYPWIHRSSVGNERFNPGCFYIDLNKYPNLYNDALEVISGMDLHNCNGDATVFGEIIHKYESLPQEYNWCTSYLDDIKGVCDNQYSWYDNYEKNNKIKMYHYSGKLKPWLSRNYPYAKHWWDYYE